MAEESRAVESGIPDWMVRTIDAYNDRQIELARQGIFSPEQIENGARLAAARVATPPPQLSDPRPASKPLDWTSLEGRDPPAIDWAIDEWLGPWATLLPGSGGIGKTLIAQQIGSALALGTPFLSRVSRPRNVLCWFGEDHHDEVWRRQKAIARSMGNLPLTAFDGKLIIQSFEGRDCCLMDCGEFGGRLIATPHMAELREQVADYGAEVVILDNVARLFGGKESDRHHVTQFVTSVVGACPGAAVLLLAHPGRAEGSEFSGSSAWENAVRMRWYMSSRLAGQGDDGEPEDANSSVRYLAKRKANYSSKDVRTFHYTDGVLVPAEAVGESWLVDGLRDKKADRVVLSSLRRLLAMNLSPSDGSSSPSFLPRQILEYQYAEGLTKRDLATAMRRLMSDGILKREQVGMYANRTPRYGIREV